MAKLASLQLNKSNHLLLIPSSKWTVVLSFNVIKWKWRVPERGMCKIFFFFFFSLSFSPSPFNSIVIFLAVILNLTRKSLKAFFLMVLFRHWNLLSGIPSLKIQSPLTSPKIRMATSRKVSRDLQNSGKCWEILMKCRKVSKLRVLSLIHISEPTRPY